MSSDRDRVLTPDVLDAMDSGKKLVLIRAEDAKVGEIRSIGGKITEARRTAKSMILVNALGKQVLHPLAGIMVWR